MAIELDQPIQSLPKMPAEMDQTVILSGRLVSFHYLGAALRRSKKVWIASAILGLIIGGAYHTVVPRKYTAYSMVYMAHPIGSDDAIEIGNDLALLDNTAVARAAIKILNEPSLNPNTLLGKTPGVAVSDNVIEVSIQGPSYQEAVRRVNAVTSAFLTFRAAQYTGQDRAVVDGLDKEIGALQTQVNSMTNTINDGNATSTQLTQVVAERASITTEVSNLQGNVQTDQLNTNAVVDASRVLTSGTTEYHSTVRLYLIDGLSGLAAALVIGIGLVSLRAMTSDRVRRREDLATIVGANVEVSTAAPVRKGARGKAGNTGPVARYFEHLVTGGARRSILAVAVDDVDAPAAAIVAAAASLVAQQKKVVLVDFTSDRVLEKRLKRFILKGNGGPVREVEISPEHVLTLYIAPKNLGPEDGRAAWELGAERWEGSDAVLALGTIELGRGAWHLRNWDQSILTVTAGKSTPQRISGTAELLRASGVSVSASILFNADSDDESVGLAPVAGPWASDTFASFGIHPPIRT